MKSLVAALTLASSTASSTPEISFIACPVYRDTDAGRKSGCWLADDAGSGIRYDVTPSAAKPDWNLAILVEGRASATRANPCGGAVLDPVRVSVLEDRPCTRHMLPAEGFPGRKYVLPARNVQPLSVARPGPKPPFANRTFHLTFDWNSSFIAYQREDFLLDQAISWIRGVPHGRITVTGYAALAPRTVSGEAMSEDAAIASERAQRVAEALFRLGIAREQIVVRDGGNGAAIPDADTDGLGEPARRRVDISVELTP